MIAAFRSSPVRSNPGFFNDNGIVAILRDSIFWIAMAISCNVHVHGICLSQVIAVNSAISCCRQSLRVATNAATAGGDSCTAAGTGLIPRYHGWYHGRSWLVLIPNQSDFPFFSRE